MQNDVEKITILRFTEEGRNNIEGMVAKELPVTIILNDQELVTLLCSPEDLRDLVIGFLASEGLLKSKDEIKNVMVDNERGVVRVQTTRGEGLTKDTLFKRIISSGCGRGASFYNTADIANQQVKSEMKISVGEVLALVKQFQRGSQLYLKTHGVHGAALCDKENILIFSEDIGRHNAIDKIFGKCLLEDISIYGRIIITSGRITSEILHKVARRNIPIIISISAPTNLGVRIADSLGITLIGLARGKRMNVYTHGWRIANDVKLRRQTNRGHSEIE